VSSGGSSGDALHAVLCAAGFNIRWLHRAIAAKGLAGLLLIFSQLVLHAARIGRSLQTPTFPTERVIRSSRSQMLVPKISKDFPNSSFHILARTHRPTLALSTYRLLERAKSVRHA